MTEETKKRRNSRARNETTIRIQLYYRNLGLGPEQGWTRDRFFRLCKILNCTQSELMGLCCVYENGTIERWMKADKIPTHVSLILTLIEACRMGLATPVVPFDLLNQTHEHNTDQ